MTPLASWLLLLSVIAVFVVPTYMVCRRAERRHVPFCTCGRCMAATTTWHPSLNDNDRAQVGARPVVSSRPDERSRL